VLLFLWFCLEYALYQNCYSFLDDNVLCFFMVHSVTSSRGHFGRWFLAAWHCSAEYFWAFSYLFALMIVKSLCRPCCQAVNQCSAGVWLDVWSLLSVLFIPFCSYAPDVVCWVTTDQLRIQAVKHTSLTVYKTSIGDHWDMWPAQEWLQRSALVKHKPIAAVMWEQHSVRQIPLPRLLISQDCCY